MLFKTHIKTLFFIALMLTFGACSNSESSNHNSDAEPTDQSSDNQDNEATQGETITAISATLDKEANTEIKDGVGGNLASIFDYYAAPSEDFENWSGKLFGRCCTEADMTYSEALSFDFSTDTDNPKYPLKNLSDTKYNTAFVFTEDQDIQINIKLSPFNNYFEKGNPKAPSELLSDDDIVLAPFTISLINGYAKSKSTFETNSRIKKMDVLHNGAYKGTVELKDIADIQQFSLNIEFKKNDTITLIPKEYYSGSKYKDVCISEIQSNLGSIAHSSINEKYSFH